MRALIRFAFFSSYLTRLLKKSIQRVFLKNRRAALPLLVS